MKLQKFMVKIQYRDVLQNLTKVLSLQAIKSVKCKL